jgi:hypothetical protein
MVFLISTLTVAPLDQVRARHDGVGATHASPLQNPALVLTGARVLDPVAGRYVPAYAVVIERDQIVAVHLNDPGALPAAAERRDLAGMTLVPGLIDFHARAAPSGSLEADFFALLSLAHGVTSVRAPNSYGSWLIARRARIRAGDVIAPRLWLTGQPLGERTGASIFATQPDVLALARDEVAGVVSQQKRAGVDWIKISGTAGPEMLRAAVTAARDAGLKISAEALRVPVAQAAELGVDVLDGTGLPVRSIDVLPVLPAPTSPPNPRQIVDAAWTQVTDSDIAAAVYAMRRRNVALVPLLAADAAAASRNAHERRVAFVRAFAKQGGRMLPGSGTGDRGHPLPGTAIHAELAQLMAAGLTPIEAIRAATIHAAEALGAAKSLGQVRAGYRADLIAVSGDPLQRIEDLSRIALIVRGGEVLERDALLKQAERATGVVR